MALKLGISQNAYSRIELNKTKFSTDTAEKIADILELPLVDLLSKDNPVISFNNNQIEKGYINNNFETQKDFFEKVIAALESQLNSAQKREEQLLKLIEKLS